jgi:hypothetical protein
LRRSERDWVDMQEPSGAETSGLVRPGAASTAAAG